MANGEPVQSASVSADQGHNPSLDLGQATPDPERLSDLDRVLGAGLSHRTHPTYGFRLHLSPLPFVLALEGRGWEEEIGVVPTAQRVELPIVQVGQFDSSLV